MKVPHRINSMFGLRFISYLHVDLFIEYHLNLTTRVLTMYIYYILINVYKCDSFGVLHFSTYLSNIKEAYALLVYLYFNHFTLNCTNNGLVNKYSKINISQL